MHFVGWTNHYEIQDFKLKKNQESYADDIFALSSITT